MKKWIRIIAGIGAGINLAFVSAGSLVPAKYAGEFLAGGVGARPCGMGNAYSALVQDATAPYWNPAGLVFLTRLQIHGMHAERFSGAVNNDFVGLGFPFGKNQALGFGFFRLGVDGIPLTRLTDPSRPLGEFYTDDRNRRMQNVPYVAGTLRDEEMAFFFSYARRSPSGWIWGTSIKCLHKQVGDFSAWGIGFDFGLLYSPFRDFRIGFVLRDGTSTLIAWDGKRKELIAPNFKSGLSYDLQIGQIRLTPALDIDLMFEGRKQASQMRIGSVSMDSHAGIEADLFRRIRFRAGMDRGRLTLGSGLEFSMLSVDYSFLPDAELGNSQRISATVAIDPDWF